jgi:hypothetical protein
MEALPIDKAVAIKEENLKMLESAKAFTITDQSGYEYVVDIVKKVKDRRKMWGNLIKPVKEAARSAWQKVVDLEKEVDTPLSVIENEVCKPKLISWEIEQENKRRAEQERISAQLKKQDEEAKLAVAVELEAGGNQQAAEHIINTPTIAPAIELPRTTAVKGVSYRDQYSAVVIDMKAFVDAVAAGKIPLEAISPNGVFLNTQAKAFKGALAYPGVEVKVNRIASVGGNGGRF